MFESPKTFEARHFSLSNPKGSDDQGNVSKLMRRVADVIEQLALEPTSNVMDIVFHSEIDDEGQDWPTFTVYLA